MFNEPPPPVIQKRMGFLSVTAICLTSIIITAVVSTAGLGVYGLRVVDKKSDNLVGMLGDLAKQLPELRDSLPPALFDAIDDERHPEYRSNIRVTVKRVADEKRDSFCRAVVEVENKGDDTISMLTLRIVALDKNGEPITERKTWVASPIQLDDDWRGPILPKETRRFAVRYFDADETASFSQEVTEIRTWRAYDDSQDNAPKGLMAIGKRLTSTDKQPVDAR
ncbi:MAG TPA: hypothetical protein VMV81_11350 [Phycisphaerae bacterium]|nr:hypothetical protein [Phycisphaerae bacterium]